MTVENTQKERNFSDFDEAAAYILQLLSKQIGINSLFIAKNDGQTNHIIKVHNSGKELVKEGSSMPLPQSFCSLSINHGPQALVIDNVSENDMTRSMEITANYGQGTFVGIPVYYKDGTVYGTICGLDDQYYRLSEDQLYTFEMMSTLLTYVLELEKANDQIQTLTAPIVPVTKGVAIVPVIGEITAQRAQVIIEHVLEKCSNESMEYLIIDVSGVLQINSIVGEYLLKLVNILKIIGVTPVITGIQPFMALKVPHFAAALKDVLIEANLESALKQLGFVLIKECKEISDPR
ncbi:STAS domain-containing protein [Planococcus sp. CPCC 101016]|uniref:STAS domain-containing protein n=1 Tax=Planococcus sp. CPCC 101016 TaxID=2599617 RepID=UPI0011B62743|nr:STAS domain-containing protein [Planococcus sp. CPCC 101016]TWT04409.1 STAS domain-containing protein [Planococcus sp. CPCC 101016]